MCLYVCNHASVGVSLCIHMYVIYILVCNNVCMYVCMYVYVCVCVCVYYACMYGMFREIVVNSYALTSRFHQ